MKTPYLEIKYDEEKVKANPNESLYVLIGTIRKYAEKKDMLFELAEDNTMCVSIKRDSDYGYIGGLAITLLVCDWFTDYASVLFYHDGDPREDEDMLLNYRNGNYDKYLDSIKKGVKHG